MINDLIIKCAKMHISGDLYNIFFCMGFVSVFLMVTLFGRKLNIPVKKSVVIVLLVYPTLVLLMFVMAWVENGFKAFGDNNIVRVFVYGPVVAYPVAKLLKLTWKDVCGVLSVGPLSVHAVSHFGCIFVGCCRGYPCSWGLYNVVKEDIRFPSQPLEAIVAWLIIFYIWGRSKKNHYKMDGLEYPIMLVLFGGTRFLFEFLRDNEKLWLGCSGLAFHALFMFVVGIIAIAVIRKKTAEQAIEN